MLVQPYLRRGQRALQRWALDPKLRSAGMVMAYGGSGFFLSAAGLAGFPQPLAMGLICAATGWRTLVMGLGAMAGYPSFWGPAGVQGIVWSASGCLLALLLGKREETRAQPLMLPVIAAFLTAVAELAFRLLLRDETPIAVCALRTVLTFAGAVLFTQTARCRDAVTDWLVGGVAVLALANVKLTQWLRLGDVCAGVIGVTGAFPAAALAGLGLDLAQGSRLPMTAVLCTAWLIRLIPFGQKWKHYAAPGFACLGIMAVCGIYDVRPLPGLLLGGAVGALLPVNPETVRYRGDTGVAQVRLELGSAVMAAAGQLVQEAEPPPIDTGALVQQVREQACKDCPAGRTCTVSETLSLRQLLEPEEADCPNRSRLMPQLQQAGQQLRFLRADRKRQGEYRAALVQQYGFLEEYLRNLADGLPRKSKTAPICFRVEAAARSRGKEQCSGDRCMAFHGSGYCYYLVLCDGMGTGPEAAREGGAAAQLLRQLLTAGFPADHALKTLNSFLILRRCAAAVTVDLAQVRLDTGIATLYKWGAAPSWVLHRSGAEKIGTASPPPGLSMEERHETVEKLSLRRGETLVLLSDGVDGEDVLNRLGVTPDAPPGELAADILEKGSEGAEDDVTAAVLRLCPVNLEVS